jgi:hypothetical protein
MRVEDYFPKGKRWWVRLHEKGGKRHEMPAELTLRRSWGRRRITPELVEDVNEGLDSRRPLVFLRRNSYAVISRVGPQAQT